MKSFRVVVVDDEPLARKMIGQLLGRDPQIEIVGEAADGSAAIDLIRRTGPDIAFLDIEMPEMGGIEVAEAIPADERPTTVFVTAYSRFATDAFDVEALDYVVKPFSDDRFFSALDRAKGRVRDRRLSGLAKRLATEAGGLTADRERQASSGHLEVIPVRRDGRTTLVRAGDLIWIESRDYYARLHTHEKAWLVRASLASFEERLDPGQFVRVHRSAIVNLDSVVAVEHLSKGQHVVVLTNDVRCRVSQARKKAVERLLLPRLG